MLHMIKQTAKLIILVLSIPITFTSCSNNSQGSDCSGVTCYWPHEIIDNTTFESVNKTGQASPGYFSWGDVDGDGDIDLVVTGDGDPTVYVYEQTAAGVFIPNLIDESLEVGQSGVSVDDLDGDGKAEIILASFGQWDTNNERYGDTLAIYHYGDDATYATDASCADERSVPGRELIDCKLNGAGFVTVEDISGDGKKDIILSTFGLRTGNSGEVIIYKNRGTVSTGYDNWEKSYLITTDDNICFPNKIVVNDIDSDGDKDIFIPSGFFTPCPAYRNEVTWGINWYEQDPTGSWTAHTVTERDASSQTSEFYHAVLLADIDGDNIKDLVTVGETFNYISGTAETIYFKGTASGTRFDSTPTAIGNGGGSLPELYDVDGDGDLDVISAQYFYHYNYNESLSKDDGASFIWFKNDGNAASWKKYAINKVNAGPSFKIAVIPGLIAGSEKIHLIGVNHTNIAMEPDWPHEAIYLFELPE